MLFNATGLNKTGLNRSAPSLFPTGALATGFAGPIQPQANGPDPSSPWWRLHAIEKGSEQIGSGKKLSQGYESRRVSGDLTTSDDTNLRQNYLDVDTQGLHYSWSIGVHMPDSTWSSSSVWCESVQVLPGIGFIVIVSVQTWLIGNGEYGGGNTLHPWSGDGDIIGWGATSTTIKLELDVDRRVAWYVSIQGADIYTDVCGRSAKNRHSMWAHLIGETDVEVQVCLQDWPLCEELRGKDCFLETFAMATEEGSATQTCWLSSGQIEMPNKKWSWLMFEKGDALCKSVDTECCLMVTQVCLYAQFDLFSNRKHFTELRMPQIRSAVSLSMNSKEELHSR